MFALLLVAVSGAMAQTETLLTTITATSKDSYSETTAGVVTVTHDNSDIYGEYGWVWWANPGSITVEAKEGYTITRCVFKQNSKTPVTVSSAPFKVSFIETANPSHPNQKKFLCQGDWNLNMNGVSSIEVYGYAPAPAPPTYSVTLAEGTEDGDKWTISPTEAAEGATVTVTYSGDKKVKSVKAVKKAVVTDLSMVDCAGKARTSMSTANCYMVHTAGAYKLPLVYGNAIKDGAANSAAWTGVAGNNTTATFPNHAGTAINAPWITKATTGEGVAKGMGITVASAELLWQDAEGLVTAVAINGDYLTLTVGKDATTQQGNALVAAKDADGKIVWSWHIWVTTETFATLTTVSTGSHNYSVTPVNLGWVPTGGEGKQGYNTYYQWGRKDPFKAQGAPAELTVYDIDDKAITGMIYTASTDATIADNIKNPTKFYYNNSNIGPCYTTYYNMWDAQQTTDAGNIITATVKTVYDPCPAGFCVPTGNLYYYIKNGGVSFGWDGTNKGRNLASFTPNVFFPALGLRDSNSGALNFVGASGFYWSASPKSDKLGYYLDINSSNCGFYTTQRANGFSIRAVAEE